MSYVDYFTITGDIQDCSEFSSEDKAVIGWPLCFTGIDKHA